MASAIGLFFGLAALIGAAQAQARHVEYREQPPERVLAATDSLLIGVTPSLDEESLQTRLRGAGYHLRRYWPAFNLAQVGFAEPVQAADQEVVSLSAERLAAGVAELEALPGVRYAALDRPIHAASAVAVEMPADPLVAQQWALSHIRAPQAWALTQARHCVTVALIDSGFNRDHVDIAEDALWENQSETTGIPARDDDGNGYIDDYHGWDWIGNDKFANDNYGHGTHVGAIIAATTGNGVGIAGLAPGARILPLRVLDRHGAGVTSQLIEAIDYAVRQDAKIINLSLVLDHDSQAVGDAIRAAYEAGILIVAATGNTARAVQWPAAYPQTVAVSATDQTDELGRFSSFGTEVTLAAPGADILSATLANRYEYQTGTSMAAAHVTALAALLSCLRPDLSSDGLVRLMQSSAVDANAVSAPGADPWLGAGRIDFQAAALSATRGLTLTMSSSTPVNLFHGSATTIPLVVTTLDGAIPVAGAVVQVELVEVTQAGGATLEQNMILQSRLLSDDAGIAEIEFTLPTSTHTFELRAQVGHARLLLPLTAQAQPAMVTVSSSGDSSVTEPDGILLDIHVVNDGNATLNSALPVTLETNLGIFPNGRRTWTTSTTTGELQIRLTPDKIAGNGTVIVRAGLLSTQHRVTFYPGDAYMVQVDSIDVQDDATAESQIELTVLVMDRFSNRVADNTVVELRAEPGVLNQTKVNTRNGIASAVLSLDGEQSRAALSVSVPGSAASYHAEIVALRPYAWLPLLVTAP